MAGLLAVVVATSGMEPPLRDLMKVAVCFRESGNHVRIPAQPPHEVEIRRPEVEPAIPKGTDEFHELYLAIAP